MAKLPEIIRVVAIEHKGEEISLQVHIQFTSEEIRRLLVPAVLEELGAQLRQNMGVGVRSTGGVL